MPPSARDWYYFREADYEHVMNLWKIGDNMAQGATLMTDTRYTERLLGAAWPGSFNKPIAQDMYERIKKVGLPQWSADDQMLAKGLQHELKQKERGLAAKIAPLREPRVQNEDEEEMGAAAQAMGGGSGDISWNVPTIVLRY